MLLYTENESMTVYCCNLNLNDVDVDVDVVNVVFNVGWMLGVGVVILRIQVKI